jgi:hypothetical protein
MFKTHTASHCKKLMYFLSTIRMGNRNLKQAPWAPPVPPVLLTLNRFLHISSSAGQRETESIQMTDKSTLVSLQILSTVQGFPTRFPGTGHPAGPSSSRLLIFSQLIYCSFDSAIRFHALHLSSPLALTNRLICSLVSFSLYCS